MKVKLTALSVMFVLAGFSQGAVSYVNNIADNPNGFEVGNWSRASVAKSFDIDGNNSYGTDGYVIMDTTNDGGAPRAVLANTVASSPSYTSGISYIGAGAGVAASVNSAVNILNPTDTGVLNLGYSGFAGTPGVAIPLQALFGYTLNRDMLAGETIRLGIMTDSLNGENRIGITDLRIVVGSSFADATMVAAASLKNGNPDMYFFDVSGLTNGQAIEIWGANSNTSGAGLNRATIGAVMFDSVTVPESSSSTLIGLGGLALILRRRK